MSSQEAGVDCSSFPSQHMTSRGGAPSSNGVSSARNTAVDSQRIGQSHPHRRGKQVSQYLLRWHLHPWGFGAHNPMGSRLLATPSRRHCQWKQPAPLAHILVPSPNTSAVPLQSSNDHRPPPLFRHGNNTHTFSKRSEMMIMVYRSY